MRALIFASILGFLFGACTKLDEPITAYFFVQNADQEYTLSVNDETLGTISSLAEVPQYCQDSLLLQCTVHLLEHKRNQYELKDAGGAVVASGRFKITDHSLSGKGEVDLGTTYSYFGHDIFVMGFNTTLTSPDSLTACDTP
jgi:hypothetical protein